MEKKLVGFGVLAGSLAGLQAFVFARIFAEPFITKAIDYESGRDAAQAVLDKAAGLPPEPAASEPFTRAVQANLGIGVGMILFGAAMGALFAVAYAICLGRVGKLQPRSIALAVAAAGFVSLYLVPFIKYPANPPSIGNPDTIKQRTSLYLGMVLASVVLLIAAVWLGQRLARRFGNWTATLIAVGAFVVAVGVVMAILPAFGELKANVDLYGHRASETPLPLHNAQGQLVYPGFPADVLWNFRWYSVGAQALLWSVIGLVFAPLAHRALRPIMVDAGQDAAHV